MGPPFFLLGVFRKRWVHKTRLTSLRAARGSGSFEGVFSSGGRARCASPPSRSRRCWGEARPSSDPIVDFRPLGALTDKEGAPFPPPPYRLSDFGLLRGETTTRSARGQIRRGTPLSPSPLPTFGLWTFEGGETTTRSARGQIRRGFPHRRCHCGVVSPRWRTRRSLTAGVAVVLTSALPPPQRAAVTI